MDVGLHYAQSFVADREFGRPAGHRRDLVTGRERLPRQQPAGGTVGYSDDQIDLIVDFLRRCTRAGQSAADQLAEDPQ